MGDKTVELHKFPPASELGPAEDYPVGSVEWAERISNRLQIGAKSVNQHTVHHLWNTIKAIWAVRPRPWEIWPEDHPFKTPDDYSRAITGHPWEFLIDVVAEFSKDSDLKVEEMRAELARAQAEYRSQGVRTDLLQYNVPKLKGGNSSEKLLRLLARDHADILARYERGEFPSVRAAAKEAGIVKPPSPLTELRKWWKKASPDERAAFLSDLSGISGKEAA